MAWLLTALTCLLVGIAIGQGGHQAVVLPAAPPGSATVTVAAALAPTATAEPTPRPEGTPTPTPVPPTPWPSS